MTQQCEIEGKFISSIYATEDRSYCVYLYRVDTENVRVVGTDLPDVEFPVRFKGNWRIDPKFGRQFQVDMTIVQMPTVNTDIIKYISSLHVGIGQRRATKMLEMVAPGKFFSELSVDPMQFTAVKGVTAKQITALQDKISQLSTQAELFSLFGNDLTMDSRHFKRIFSYFKGDTQKMLKDIQENPFVLMSCGYQFSDLDGFCAARKFLYTDDPRRLLAASQQALLDAKGASHAGLPKDILIQNVQALIRREGPVEADTISDFLDAAFEHGDLEAGFGLCYLPRAQKEESIIAEGLVAMAQKLPEDLSRDQFQSKILDFENEKGITLSAEQKEAVWTALRQSVSVITGGPGTGKSTILDALLFCWREFFGENWQLMAPTGRASVRMTETTGEPASTLHSALQIRPDDDDRSSITNLEMGCETSTELVVVDEVSMIDQSIMAALVHSLTGWKSGNRQHLVLVGDRNQLPSVGWGNVLADIIDSGVIPVSVLSVIYRQGRESPIVTNARHILNGETELLWDKEFKRFHVGNDTANMQAACTFYERCVKAYGVENVALLSPYRGKTEICCNALNRMLQDVVNPEHGQDHINAKGKTFRVGDRVMQMKNTETLANGDIGTISAIYPHADDTDICLVVKFENGLVERYIRDRLEQLELAYAMSIHKSQGAQYDVVITVLPNTATGFLRRNLIYTAITRSKKNVAIIGPTSTIAACIHNDRQDERYTRLSLRLKASARVNRVAAAN